MTTTLDTWLNDHGEKLVAIRRDLHAHPELGFKERYTAAVVARKLREWGVEVTEGPHYDFNDDIIPSGVRYWAGLVAQELGSGR